MTKRRARGASSGAHRARRSAEPVEAPSAPGWVAWRKHPDALVVTGLLLVFGLSRALAARRGLEFNMDILPFGYQFLDPVLLREELLRSLWYQHSQPPLFNLFLGVVLKVAPGTGRTLFLWSFRLLGALLTVACYGMGREFGLKRAWAAAATLLAVLSPAALLYEHWLFYTYPTALLVCVCGWFGGRFARTGSAADGAVLFGAMACLIGTRSVFHPVWFVALAGLLMVAMPEFRRRVVLCGAVPLVLVLGLYAKNLVLFGVFGSSSWLGMSLAKVATTGLTEEEWERLRALPDYPGILDVQTFENARAYEAFVTPWEPWGVRALDAFEKSEGFWHEGRFIAFFNLNHGQVIESGRRFGEAARWVVAREPAGLMRSLDRSLIVFFKPASEYLFVAQTPGRIRGYERWWNLLVHGKVGEHTFIKRDVGLVYDRRGDDWSNIGFLIPVLVLLGLAAGPWLLVAAWHSGRRLEPRETGMVLLSATIWWVVVLGVVLEVGENNRFRYMIEPANIVLAAAYVGELMRRRAGAGLDDGAVAEPGDPRR